MPEQPVPVFWQLASDDQFRNIERFGSVLASPGDAHSVHVEAHGLLPYGLYWYRFHAGGHTSQVGCTRTLPDLHSRVEGLRFAYASESDQQVGRSPVYGQIARDDLDFVLFAGNYANQVRSDDECTSLDSHDLLALYRARFARCRADPDLQAAHRALPWISVLDTPIQAPRSGAPGARGHSDELAALHRAAARKAYWEHMPVRAGCQDARFRRGSRISLGPLATLEALELAALPARHTERLVRFDTAVAGEWSAAPPPAQARSCSRREPAAPPWRLVVQPGLLERDFRAWQLARCYVRCELDRESFRTDFLAPSPTHSTNSPLEERASLHVHLSEAQRVVVTTNVSTSRDEDRRRF